MKKPEKKKNNVLWCLSYTKRLITLITICYFTCTAIELALIILAIFQTGEFSFLDTFISENSDVFKVVMSATIFKFGIENIFKYNDFGGRIPNKEVVNDEDSGEGTQAIGFSLNNEEEPNDDDSFGN